MKNYFDNITFLVILGIAVMLLLVVSMLLAVIFNQKKKNQHRIALANLREQQHNQLIEAAIRSEESERHRIAETLHDEVGAILSSAKLHLLGERPDSVLTRSQYVDVRSGVFYLNSSSCLRLRYNARASIKHRTVNTIW